jgi:hypothetical protein
VLLLMAVLLHFNTTDIAAKLGLSVEERINVDESEAVVYVRLRVSSSDYQPLTGCGRPFSPTCSNATRLLNKL